MLISQLVAGIIGNQCGDAASGVRLGIAPQAKILSLRVLDENGLGTYEDVIQGIQHVVARRYDYNIRVMNIS